MDKVYLLFALINFISSESQAEMIRIILSRKCKNILIQSDKYQRFCHSNISLLTNKIHDS